MSQQGTFQGRNAEVMREMAIASLVSHAHMIVIDKPGSGKTSVLKTVGRAVYDVLNGEFVFVRVDPSTPPEKIKGLPDFDLAVQGKYVLVTDNTAYDPRAKLVLLDELMRAMDVVFDPVLDVMDRQDTPTPDDAPIIWATSNWMSVTERIEAMKDRFTFRVWLEKETINVAKTVRSQMLAIGGSMTVANSLPDKAKLLEVYAARPGEHAIDAVTRVIEHIVQEASDTVKDGDGRKSAKTFDINYRRIQQWQQVLFRMSYFLTGDADFNAVPANAVKALNYAWPSDSLTEQQSWQQVLVAIADPLETALAALKQAAFAKYREIVNTPGLKENQKGLQMGLVVAEREMELWRAAQEMAVDRDDNGLPVITDEVKAKITAAIDAIKVPYARMLKGKDPFAEE